MIRLFARSTQILLDLAVLSLAFWLAFLLRFEGNIPLQMLKRLFFLWPYVTGFQFLVLVAFGVHRFSWRFIGLREATRIFAATAGSTGVLLILRVVTGVVQYQWGYAQYLFIPIGVLAIDAALAFLGISGMRVMRRLQTERVESALRRKSASAKEAVPTMLVGAGQAGLLVVKELATRPDLGMVPVGFLDDDDFKQGTTLNGVPVLGSTSRLKELCQKHGAKQVLITIANAPGSDIRRIKALADQADLPAKIIPGLYEIVGGQVNLSRIRSVSIEDLLGRDAVQLEMEAIAQGLQGRVVMVTGAGGSIGSELCRQIARFGPAKLLLVEQAENALFHIHRELLASHLELSSALVPCIADVCDRSRMEGLFRAHKPSAVFHAAAHKHVPMMEWNPGEAVKNNVLGTRTLADLAHAFGARELVMISTDKAVNPTSVMGVSKRSAEIYIQALSQRSQTRFVTVRFGNVLGSAGSVVPIFQEQIERGGPVTVTHPEMRRYFMTIPEACQLVLQAGSMGKGGEIFILDMGEPVKIVDLARDLITLSGLRPGEDIEIVFTGMRPGEKLFEELSVSEESADKTRHPKIFVGRFRPHDLDEVASAIDELSLLADSGDAEGIRARFKRLVPEYLRPLAEGAAARSEPVAAEARTGPAPLPRLTRA